MNPFRTPIVDKRRIIKRLAISENSYSIVICYDIGREGKKQERQDVAEACTAL